MARSYARPARPGVDRHHCHRSGVLRSDQEGYGGCIPFRSRRAADRARTAANDPASRQQGSGSGSDSDGSDIITVYEFCAAEYGWGPEYIEAQVTDSQLVAYLDEAIARKARISDLELDRLTLAVNTGTLITYDQKALRRWQSRHRQTQTPSDFSSTVSRLATMFPGKVQTH